MQKVFNKLPPQSDPHYGTKKVQNSTPSQHITSYNTPEADATPVYVEKLHKVVQNPNNPILMPPSSRLRMAANTSFYPADITKKWREVGGGSSSFLGKIYFWRPMH